ncbi:hypothetical protein FB446DRAFT_710722 [Lentinula raphanica]|nr:hypothetical protein FB446DRAFT_710722 [Lentinula raphanica]
MKMFCLARKFNMTLSHTFFLLLLGQVGLRSYSLVHAAPVDTSASVVHTGASGTSITSQTIEVTSSKTHLEHRRAVPVHLYAIENGFYSSQLLPHETVKFDVWFTYLTIPGDYNSRTREKPSAPMNHYILPVDVTKKVKERIAEEENILEDQGVFELVPWNSAFSLADELAEGSGFGYQKHGESEHRWVQWDRRPTSHR